MSNLPIKRDEVHPINTYRPPTAPTAYKLIKWKPVYDMIVAGHIIGKSNKQLAADFDFTPVHISNILRSDQAQVLIKQAHDNVRAQAVSDAEEALDIQKRIQLKVNQKTEMFLDNEELFKNSPFAYMDALKHISSRSNPPAPVSVNVTNNTQINNTQNNLKVEELQRLNKALEISSGMILGPTE